MAASNAINLMLSFFLIALASVPLHARLVTADVNFISKTCNQTSQPDYCVSTLRSVKRSINATTVAELAGISLDIALADASATLSTIRDFADENPGTPLEEAMNLCAQIYDNAIDDLYETQEDLRSQEYDGASTLVDQAEGAPESCEGAFTDVTSPITKMNQSVKDHCGLSSDLVDLLTSV